MLFQYSPILRLPCSSSCIFLQRLCTSLHFPTPPDSIFVTVYFACVVHTTPISTLTVSSPQCTSVCFSKLDLTSFQIYTLHSLHLSPTAKESNLQSYIIQHVNTQHLSLFLLMLQDNSMTMLCFILTQLTSLHLISPHVHSQMIFSFVWANQFILPIQLLPPPNPPYLILLAREALKVTSHFHLSLLTLHLLQFPHLSPFNYECKADIRKREEGMLISSVCLLLLP